MELADGQRGREAGPRRSPFDLIMNQIRRKRPGSDKKGSGRFLSRQSDGGGIPEDRETEEREEKQKGEGTDPAESVETLYDGGWGRVCVFVQRLGKRADSRSLSLAHCDLTATDTLELGTLLPCLPQLEEMDLSWNELIGGSLRALTSHLLHVGGLRTLKLCSCRLNADDISALGGALEHVPLLEVLDLSWNVGIGGGTLEGLLGKFRPTLKELHLVACQLTAADASTLGRIISGLPKLCVLDISCNPLLAEAEEGGAEEGGPGGIGMGDLVPFLSHCPSLTTLRLHSCGLTPNTLNIFGGSLRYLPSLRELDLSCNKKLSGGLTLLAPHLTHLPRLESLSLHLCYLTHTDLASLIQVLPSLSELTKLDVSSNKEAGGVVQPLVSALPLLQMRQLPLNSCSLTEDSFTALALAIPHLRHVDVSWCKVAGGRLALLLEALQPGVLQELHLSSCDLTTDDLLQLGVVCKHGCLSSVRVLDLSYNGGVGPEGWVGLFGAGGLGSLEDVDLSLRPLTSACSAAWLPSLLSALPHLPALVRLGMQRWTLTNQGRDKLNHALRKRAVLLEWDTPISTPSPNQDRLDEMQSEE
ncbi:leucine-rich repeat-containing protein 31 [Osmerus eperlanus]|uniref:leucine-rich repeat-containing protein 31 n=1 Tax=Osmerus eperlanus TaxID=29151 RepID=UPI002E1383AC